MKKLIKFDENIDLFIKEFNELQKVLNKLIFNNTDEISYTQTVNRTVLEGLIQAVQLNSLILNSLLESKNDKKLSQSVLNKTNELLLRYQTLENELLEFKHNDI